MGLDDITVGRDGLEVMPEAFRTEADYFDLADKGIIPPNGGRLACIDEACAELGCATNVAILSATSGTCGHPVGER